MNTIIADPDNPNHAYIAFSGFRQGDDAANVWETHQRRRELAEHQATTCPTGRSRCSNTTRRGDVLFASTDVGVFDRKDGDGTWYKISVGLPNAPVLDLKLSGDGKELIVATFGRSNFKLPLSVDATDGGGVGGSVTATLGLTLGTQAGFGAFTPGVDKRPTPRRRRRTSISTAGDATLSVFDPSANAPGRLVNGSFSLPTPVQAKAASPAGLGGVAGDGDPLTLLTYTGPVSNDPATISFEQQIGENDALRTAATARR